MPKSCKWCFRDETDHNKFPFRSAACGSCKAWWEKIWRTVTVRYTNEGYACLRKEAGYEQQESLFWQFRMWVMDLHRSAHFFEFESYIPERFLKTPTPPVPHIKPIQAIKDVRQAIKDRLAGGSIGSDAGTGGSRGSGSGINLTGGSSSSGSSTGGSSSSGINLTVNLTGFKSSSDAITKNSSSSDMHMHEDVDVDPYPLEEDLFGPPTPPLEVKETVDSIAVPSPVVADDDAVDDDAFGGWGRRVRPRFGS